MAERRGWSPTTRVTCPWPVRSSASTMSPGPTRALVPSPTSISTWPDSEIVHGRRVDLEHFQVVRAVELVVHDGRRLQDAVALGEGALAVALIDELDPAVQHVEHLEVAEVLVQPRRVQLVLAGRVLLDPD